MFEKMKLKKEYSKLFNLLYEKASDTESIINLSCSTYLFPNNNQKYLTYNQYTRIECLLFMAKIFDVYLKDIERIMGEKDLDTESFYELEQALKDNNNNCVNHTIVNYLGYTEDILKKLRFSRSDYYYYATKGLYLFDGLEKYMKVIVDAFVDLLSYDIHSNNPIDVNYKNGKILIPFTEMTSITFEANFFFSYAFDEVKKALSPIFQKSGISAIL